LNVPAGDWYMCVSGGFGEAARHVDRESDD